MKEIYLLKIKNKKLVYDQIFLDLPIGPKKEWLLKTGHFRDYLYVMNNNGCHNGKVVALRRRPLAQV